MPLKLCTRLKPVPEDVGRWVFPVIRNMSCNFDFDDLVSIQPMKGEESQVFYIDYVKAKTPWWRKIFRSVA